MPSLTWWLEQAPRLPNLIGGVAFLYFALLILRGLRRLRRREHRNSNILQAESLVVRALGEQHHVDPELIRNLDRALTDSGDSL